MFAARATEERRTQGKDTGTVRFDDSDFVVVADLPKRVDRDQDHLAAMVERIRAAGAHHAHLRAQHPDLAERLDAKRIILSTASPT